ncbi:MAG: DNA-3-methyladenine glycosylase 2 family protein [Actinobacteria bacterium]|nr:DNA-3-methyladenine glycosylase 2 family protein [Actinomycetota bacterium]
MTRSSELSARGRTWCPGAPLDLVRTLAPLQRGGGDPTQRVTAGAVWRALATPEGPATLRLVPAGGSVQAAAWGRGAEWALAGVPDLLGGRDDASGFAPTHPLLRTVLARHPGVRIGRTGLVFDQVVPAVLEQKVTGVESRRSWRELLTRFGAPPPGPAPAGMRAPPDPGTWLALPDWEWHRAGVDVSRRRTIRAAATVAARLEECAAMPAEQAARRLRAVPGIGAWTAAEVAQRALGDADAVSVGDYHLPALVGWALIGERVDDDGMLALLADYRPHRHRVVRLVELSGVRPPRSAPRAPVRDFRSC